MRKIPATMATQHPDNAGKAYFCDKRFISAQDEIEECYRCFSELGVGEYMWDWEGKFVDEAVIDRLFTSYHEFFKKNQIGKDIFLTFRIPNVWLETSHKLPRAFMNLITAENAARNYKLHSPPLFEVILPMTTEAKQLIYIQKTFTKIAHATEEIFDMKSNLKMVDVIPLFETFESIFDSKKILKKYLDFLKKDFSYTPDYMRIFTARSDPAMNSGFLPAKLGSKLAVNFYHEFGEENGIEVFPWIGGGSLPFRGGINPENLSAAIDEYKGVATLTIQSAFRYDYDLDTVKKSIDRLNKEIPANTNKYTRVSPKETKILREFIEKSDKIYKETVENIADIINRVATRLPSHRERVQHIGLFGYSRGIGKVSLPRAIKFTGALYSLGVPPELIASGRSLQMAQDMGILDLIHHLCPYLKEDFRHAGHYFNQENLEILAKDNRVWNDIKNGINYIEKYTGAPIGPEKPHHLIHRNLSSNIYQKFLLNEDFSDDVLAAAEIRKSLG